MIEVVASGSVAVASESMEVVAPGSVEVADLVCLSLACPNICQSWPLQEDVAPDSVEVAAGLAKDVAPGSAKAASGLAEDVAPTSLEVAALAACLYQSLACPKIHLSASQPPQEDVAPGSEEDARPKPALNSVAVLSDDLMSTVCQRSTARLMEYDFLVGASA